MNSYHFGIEKKLKKIEKKIDFGRMYDCQLKESQLKSQFHWKNFLHTTVDYAFPNYRYLF